jgi:hypothetical protein
MTKKITVATSQFEVSANVVKNPGEVIPGFVRGNAASNRLWGKCF